jgi:hypothetical protein
MLWTIYSHLSLGFRGRPSSFPPRLSGAVLTHSCRDSEFSLWQEFLLLSRSVRLGVRGGRAAKSRGETLKTRAGLYPDTKVHGVMSCDLPDGCIQPPAVRRDSLRMTFSAVPRVAGAQPQNISWCGFVSALS